MKIMTIGTSIFMENRWQRDVENVEKFQMFSKFILQPVKY